MIHAPARPSTLAPTGAPPRQRRRRKDAPSHDDRCVRPPGRLLRVHSPPRIEGRGRGVIGGRPASDEVTHPPGSPSPSTQAPRSPRPLRFACRQREERHDTSSPLTCSVLSCAASRPPSNRPEPRICSTLPLGTLGGPSSLPTLPLSVRGQRATDYTRGEGVCGHDIRYDLVSSSWFRQSLFFRFPDPLRAFLFFIANRPARPLAPNPHLRRFPGFHYQ